MTATACDPEKQLARVEFQTGTTVLATDTTAPYCVHLDERAGGHLQPERYGL